VHICPLCMCLWILVAPITSDKLVACVHIHHFCAYHMMFSMTGCTQIDDWVVCYAWHGSSCMYAHTKHALTAGMRPGALAGLTKLQHLNFDSCEWSGPAEDEGTGNPMPDLRQLTQLTYLRLCNSLSAYQASNIPAAAYSALTASSKLQHLDISECVLPAGVWQHLFPAGRQLPHLTSLDIDGVEQPHGVNSRQPLAGPEGSLLASCCPRLPAVQPRWVLCSAH
jgi:hypothetical protein